MATIAEDVGYESEVAFRKAFGRITGQTPGAARVMPTVWRQIAPGRAPLQFTKTRVTT
ncbi:MAG: hypothetical protein H0T88_08575 [Lysobacter sp.]|nr:hypothetical protein [Lysobacter sp.]